MGFLKKFGIAVLPAIANIYTYKYIYMSEELYHVQIDTSTIDGNVEFVHSQYSCILTSKVSIHFLCPKNY